MVVNKQNLMRKAGIECQNKIAGLFKKYGLQREQLDKEKKDKMPDYCVYFSLVLPNLIHQSNQTS